MGRKRRKNKKNKHRQIIPSSKIITKNKKAVLFLTQGIKDNVVALGTS